MGVEDDSVACSELADEIEVRFFALVELTCNDKLHAEVPDTLLSHGPQKQVKPLVLPYKPEEEDVFVSLRQFKMSDCLIP